MKFNPKALPITSKALFTIVGGAVLINPVFAQEQASEELEEVVVTGLRGSLKASLETKRDALGVVDSINAEDIGKFPDTNLAESLQRITGISIDRRNGEGAQVTARGFGPQFNLITLNGRQLPSADAFGSGDAVTGGQGAAGRSFNFANLASEAVSAVEVYKTGRADIASGGIGATINIKTARPLDNDGMVFNAGVKGLYDESAPFGNSVTPELSGIFSFANDSKTFGIGLNATHSKRKAGGVESTVNDWVMRSWNDAALPGAMNANTIIVNRPANGTLYGIPNDVRYAFSTFERERINAQAIVQFAPTDSLTFTLDYTAAQNEITQDRGEQTMWLQQGNTFDEVHFDTGNEVATPVYIFEMTGGTLVPGSGYSNKDFGFEQQHNEQKNELDSLGFNMDWQVTDRFSLSLDGHKSEAKSLPNDPVTGGSQTAFSFAGVPMCAGNGAGVGQIPTPPAPGSNPNLPNPPPCAGFVVQEYDFSRDLPVATRLFYQNQAAAFARQNGNANYIFNGQHIGSQVMRVNYQQADSEIKQYRLDGKFDLNDNNRFAFGVEQRDMDWHQRSSNNQMTMGNWGAVDAGTPRGMSLTQLLTPYNLVGLFSDFDAGTASTNAYRANANDLARWAFANGYTNWDTGSGPNGLLTYNHTWGNDNYVTEEVKAAYLSYTLKGEMGSMPFNLNLGYRYEDTDVTSTSFIAIPIAVRWDQNNDFAIPRGSTIEPFTEETSYDNALPNIDFDIGLTDSLKARASYSITMARANVGQLTTGAAPGNPNGATLINPAARGGGNANNPYLIPLESTNYDVSLEWYFNDTGYVSVGYWKKDVDNFIGNSIVPMSLYGLTDPTSGPDAQAAQAFLAAQGLAIDDTTLFIATALQRFATLDRPAFDAALSDLQGTESLYSIDGNASDPLYQFNMNVPLNQEVAKIDGFEIGGQYFFGESGFGVLANYTIVNGGDATEFDDAGATTTNQFALLGLSDTANAVLMFEKFGFTARLAWNWRDEFLLAANQGNSRNPRYVEEYQQFDLSLGFDVSDNISVSFDAINLTGEDIRWHGRSDNMMIRLEDQSARYAVGARYKF
jgi:TonB-dependent receptor